ECRIIGMYTFGSGLPAETVSDLAGVPMLDGDFLPRGDRKVEGAGGGGDVERHVMMCGQHGDPISADLVRGVTVGGDTIGPHDHGLDASLPHHLCRHR